MINSLNFYSKYLFKSRLYYNQDCNEPIVIKKVFNEEAIFSIVLTECFHCSNLQKYVKLYKQGNRWKRGMLPKSLLSIKGRSCNQSLLVHQDMTKKTTFYEKN